MFREDLTKCNYQVMWLNLTKQMLELVIIMVSLSQLRNVTIYSTGFLILWNRNCRWRGSGGGQGGGDGEEELAEGERGGMGVICSSGKEQMQWFKWLPTEL